MKISLLASLIAASSTMPLAVSASDYEALKSNPYTEEGLFVPNVVVGVEKSRAQSEKQYASNKAGLNGVVGTGVKPPIEQQATAKIASLVANVDENISPIALTDKEPVESGASGMPSTAMGTVSADVVISNIPQPSVKAAQLRLEGTPQSYLMVSHPSSRVYVSKADGRVYFHAEKGTLKSNVEALLSSTEAHMPLIYEISNQHENPTDVWIYGDTVLDILNALLINYSDPHPVVAETYLNRVVRISYDKKNRQG